MSEMVERIARALCELEFGKWDAADFNETLSGCDPDEQRDAYREQAIAAIKAMREPTEHMLDKGSEAGWECVEFSPEPGEGIDGYNMEPAWYAMIDAALPTPEKDKDDGR